MPKCAWSHKASSHARSSDHAFNALDPTFAHHFASLLLVRRYSLNKDKGGSGLADTDLLVFLSIKGEGIGSCGGSTSTTLAFAGTCKVDQKGRPVVGT